MKNYTDEIKELKEAIAKLEQEQAILSLLGHCKDGHTWKIKELEGSFTHLHDIVLVCNICKIEFHHHFDEGKLYVSIDGKETQLEGLDIPEPTPIPVKETFPDNPYIGKGSYKVNTSNLLADAQARGEL